MGDTGVFQYNSDEFDVTNAEIAKINSQFEADIKELIDSLSSILGCGTSGPIYDAFVEMFNRDIKPLLEAMFYKDEDILKTTQTTQRDYDSTTSDVINSLNR